MSDDTSSKRDQRLGLAIFDADLDEPDLPEVKDADTAWHEMDDDERLAWAQVESMELTDEALRQAITDTARGVGPLATPDESINSSRAVQLARVAQMLDASKAMDRQDLGVPN